MKKLLILSVLMVLGAGVAMSQNYMVVNSETIFKSIDEYNTAVEEIDTQAQQYQQNIDDAYAQIEEQYNSYMQQKQSLSQSEQQAREQSIIDNEKRVAEYQEAAFGSEGTISKLTNEKLEPIQTKVFEAIGDYAIANKFGLVLDIATNPTIIYYDTAVDKTDAIIKLLQ
jgi:outer membrane protein